MKLRTIMFLPILLGTLIFCSNAMATPTDPMQLMKTTSDQMLTALKDNQAKLHKNPQIISDLVHNILLPHVDLQSMARRALGRDAWQQASEQQRNQFVDQFTTLLINTYASAFAAYQNETVQFMPIRGNVEQQKSIAIDSQIIQPDGPTIAVTYRLVRRQDDWKVVDFSVEGISLVSSFQQQFAEELAQSGMDKLLLKMAQHNQKLRNQPPKN